MQAICDAGCKEQFEIVEFKTAKINEDIEKIYFNCTHCGHEYVSFYTDAEVRLLQEKIRKVQSKFANKQYNQKVLEKQEQKIRAQIKAKMDELKEKYGS
ncbi:MAG TPA: hypothetical protein GX523_15275 [Desulfitobacterium dehalogenans]|uniref:Transglycosylase n=1 Tax=Desulfitobacterium dehalogenans TaxID=36854 RepID=A0A7C7D7D8_9FIRM|nr:hypothetical protein [Desulfitobacterium dehalogenans]